MAKSGVPMNTIRISLFEWVGNQGYLAESFFNFLERSFLFMELR